VRLISVHTTLCRHIQSRGTPMGERVSILLSNLSSFSVCKQLSNTIELEYAASIQASDAAAIYLTPQKIPLTLDLLIKPAVGVDFARDTGETRLIALVIYSTITLRSPKSNKKKRKEIFLNFCAIQTQGQRIDPSLHEYSLAPVDYSSSRETARDPT
jgi:hypothetical protein